MHRRDDWFVPSFGPDRFGAAVGLLSPPYAGMVLSFTVIGVMLALRSTGTGWRRSC